MGIGTNNPSWKLTVAGQGNFSRDNQGECCSGGDFTLSLAETTVNTGRKAGIQFHNGGVAEGQLRLDSGLNGRELKAYSYQTDMDLHATGMVQGDQGLCIGNDCRSSWPTSSGGNITGSGTLNYLSKFTGTSPVTIGNSQMFDNGTNVGIGTANPATKLEVQGGPIKATGGLIIETRTSDPSSAELVNGRMWLRTDF